MVGSGPDDGDVLEMGPEKPRRGWAIGRRSRLVLAIAGLSALLAVGGTLAGLRLSSSGPADPALARLITDVTTVPVSTTGLGLSVYSPSAPTTYSGSIPLFAGSLSLTKVNGPPLTSGGKPEVLYVAAEYCPYCVAENWPLIVALSRFGEFSGLSTSRSPNFDNVRPVDGWTFYGSSYTSPYLAFAPVETYSNVLVNRKADPSKPKSYRPLQRLTAGQQAVFGKFDSLRETPFFDFGGKSTLVGSNIVPDPLVGLTWDRIAADLRRPATPAGDAILGAADALTAELCTLTGDRPASACSKS